MSYRRKEKREKIASRPHWTELMPGIAVDCVIFGYHAGELKVLVLEYKNTELCALPGGFVRKQEDLDDAAKRVLSERTGLRDIYLSQFYTFGSLARHDTAPMEKIMKQNDMVPDAEHFLMQRFISVGYYALVDYKKAELHPGPLFESCSWYDANDLPGLMQDHQHIAEKALGSLRGNMNSRIAGLNLLQEVFTMADLKQLYETILGKKLSRTGFHRKMINSGLLERLGKKKTGKSHRSPYLYRFAR